MSDEARPVLMSAEIASFLGLLGRVERVVTATTFVVRVTEAELLAYGASRIDWGEADADGYYTPTMFSESPDPIP